MKKFYLLQKIRSTRAYRDDFDTWYTVLVPFVYNGAAGISFPGAGEGHATHIGKAKVYFNQLVPFDHTPTRPVILYFPELGVPASVSINGRLRIVNSIVVETIGSMTGISMRIKRIVKIIQSGSVLSKVQVFNTR